MKATILISLEKIRNTYQEMLVENNALSETDIAQIDSRIKELNENIAELKKRINQ
jgi:hypothetical protein